MDKDKYTCAVCKNTYEKGRSDEEANEQAKEIWGEDNASERENFVVVCDDCFKNKTPEEVKEMGKEYQENKIKEPSEKEVRELHEDMECTDTQRHLKECKKCSPETNQEGWWIEEFEELIARKAWHEESCPAHSRNMRPEEDCDCIYNFIKEDIKSFISKVAKVERGKYPEGFQGNE